CRGTGTDRTPASCAPRGGCASGQCRASATCVHRRQHPSLTGSRSNRDRRRRIRRRRAHSAGVVRLFGKGTGPEENSPDFAGAGGGRRMNGRIVVLSFLLTCTVRAQESPPPPPAAAIFLPSHVYTTLVDN